MKSSNYPQSPVSLGYKKVVLWWCLATWNAIICEGEASSTRIAFGSCHKNHRATVPSIWERVVEDPLDAFVWMGDVMYPSSRDPVTHQKRYGPAPVHELEQGLDAMKINETIGYTKLLRTGTPIYGVWDDHDYGGNDMGKFMPDRKERQDVFWDFVGYRPHSHDGMYHSIDIFKDPEASQEHTETHRHDHVKLILLDTRWFRDDHCIPSVAHKYPLGNVIACTTRWATAGLNLWKLAGWWDRKGCEHAEMLGEDQWKWFQEELLSSQADLNIIVSSIQIWTTNPAVESWGQFPGEREHLWNLLQEYYSKGKSPVMFWSGDVHHAEISGHEGYVEVTSSGLTHHCGQPKIYGQLCQPILEHFHRHRYESDTFYIGLNFGVLQVDWESRVATVQIKNGKGETVLQLHQSLDASLDQLPPYQRIPQTWNGHLLSWLKQLLLPVLVAIGFVAWYKKRDSR